MDNSTLNQLRSGFGVEQACADQIRDSQRIAKAMHGDRTIQVNLEEPIPVLIVYATAIVLEGGEVHLFDDLYGHDAALEKVLAAGYPYPQPDLTSGARGPRPRE